MIVRGLIGGLFQVALFYGLLIIPAGLIPGGTWYWPRALLFVAVYGLVLEFSVIALGIFAPASLEARLRVPVSRKQPVADRFVTLLLFLLIPAWFVLIPIDVFYLKLLPMPKLLVSVLGGLVALVGFGISVLAIYQNSFAVPIVEDQTDRGQELVDHGLYGIVRHPLYLGLIPFTGGIALWLQSYASLIAVLLVLVVLIMRIWVEERTLRKVLPGYGDYTRKVPYRLLPFVW